MNYITVLGYPEHPDYAKYWPAQVQLIGKDIIRFHALIWPAMLIGLSQPVEQNLVVHGFISSGGQKMSKTLGNVIDPLEMVDTYGLDALRYYLARHIPSQDDGDFTLERFEAVYNGELANELGNAVSRVAAMITRYQEGVIGDVKLEIHDSEDYHEALEAFKFDRALEFVWSRIQELNRYLEVEKPWELAKTDKDHLKDVLGYSAGSLLEIADLLEPFMPAASLKIRTTFETGVVVPLGGPLFPRIEKQA